MKWYQNNLHKGFSLVEVIIVSTLYTILMLVISYTIMQLYQQNAYTFAQSHEIDLGRRGVMTWMTDARNMSLGADGSYALATLNPYEIAFYADIDKDSSVEYVRYVLEGTTLYKYIHKASGFPAAYNRSTPTETHILSEYVQNQLQATPIFTYYGGDGLPLASPNAMVTDARYVHMMIIVNVDPLRSPGEFKLQGSITPRNLKDNL